MSAAEDSVTFPVGDIDATFVSRDGWSLIIGWLNDEPKPLRAVAWLRDGEVISATSHIARCRRDDAATAVGAPHGKLLGFWTVMRPKGGLSPSGDFQLKLWAGDECKTFKLESKPLDNQQLREMALEYFASARYFTNHQAEAVHQLESGLGQVLTDLNQEITNEIIDGVYVTRFGQAAEALEGSFVVCLFGKAEYLFVQSALFSQCPGARDYEFVFVSNSPELAERLVKEATMASRIYNVAITLVILPSNAGFGAANNVAVKHARSKRILIVNPDVFPRDTTWASRHSEIVSSLPIGDTKIFGAPLYYDDGSLMHSGMYFDIDAGVSIRDGRAQPHEIIRVEHYAKGAPPQTPGYLQSRRVPAVTGAFISVDRGWFEYLGGFSTEYVFGHYEDADLCLKSLKKGHSVWVHPVAFWHLEGKGSTRRLVHEGGSTVNRWHFTEQWKEFIADGLLGKEPARLAAS
ncbi:MAG TPA: hypothetical protein VM782_24140, partial [Stellaceae bacterium]|nr:hypothetical protein [Stellaceae bacterium]